MALSLAAFASDKFIDISEAPQSVQTFAQKNFDGKAIASVSMDSTLFGIVVEDYEVVFCDGTKVKFDGDGNWRKISAKTSAVPSVLVPDAILNYIAKNFNASPVVEIKRTPYGYKTELSSKLELKFSHDFIFMGLD